ncbi:MAG: type II toxin-antitoxin system VapC family toxin [Dehalococcoidia bacterium]|nr:type II toxin-antitoxin system VapC family toxin [Dehalococcoidia bacterium]
MRTTIEIDEAKLVKLKKMAAERGERGFSVLIDEALERYLDAAAKESFEERRRALETLFGAWDEDTAAQVRERINESRRLAVILADSDCAIDYLRGRAVLGGFFVTQLMNNQVAVSTITVFELLFGAQIRGRFDVESILARVDILPVSEVSARLSAEEGSRLAASGNRLDTPDLLIAGVALEHGLSLVTRNRRHFSRINGLTLLDPD